MTTTQLATNSTSSTASTDTNNERNTIHNNKNIDDKHTNRVASGNNKSTNLLINPAAVSLTVGGLCNNSTEMQRTSSITEVALASPSSHNTSSASTTQARPMQSDEDFNIKFVNLVRIHRCLYDKKVPEYRNRDNQEKAWALISQETQESIIHCKERWRNLRACLSRYIKQQNSNDPQHKPYYLTEHMAFLLPYLKSTRNSLDGNNSLAQLFQYTQLQQQSTATLHVPSSITGAASLQALAHTHFQANGLINGNPKVEFKHSLSDNDDEETIDAFDPAVTASFQQQHNDQNEPQLARLNGHCSSPAHSDTASANSLQNFIPDVQLSELRTPVNGDFCHEPKRIKTECGDSSAVGHPLVTHPLYCSGSIDNADMEFFRSILPDIASLTAQQKRKFKIGILELIDEVMVKYPAAKERNLEASSMNTNTIGGNSHQSKSRRNSTRSEWKK